MLHRLPRRMFAAAPAAVVLLTCTAFAAPNDDAGRSLIAGEASDGAVAAPVMAEPGVVRARAVQIDAGVLESATMGGGVDSIVEFDLFDDAWFLAETQRIVHDGQGRLQWVGTIEGGAGWATFVVRDGLVAGHVRIPGGPVYQIRPSDDGSHTVIEVDTTQLPGCATGPENAVGVEAGEEHAATFEPGRSGAVAGDLRGEVELINVDLMIVYTDEARIAAGGTDAMRALLDAAVFDTNVCYENSDVQINLISVLKYETDYDQSGNGIGTDLNRLAGMSDGFMDEIHQLRDDFGADMVTLIVRDAVGACGIAALMTNPSPGFEDNAFSVTAMGCISGLTFPHELGHNQGCAHDRQNSSNGAYPYSFGYRDPIDATWRTVMAYAPGTRIMHFSNPDVLFTGEPTGVPVGESQQAHNALSLNNTSTIVAGWRPTIGSVPENVAASDGDFGDRVLVTWDGVSNASGYEVWRGVLNDPFEATRIHVATDESLLFWNDFSAEVGTVYYYWMKSRFQDGGVSLFSDPDTGFLAEPVMGDLNGDGVVNGTDLAILLGSWGPGGGAADIDGDGDVDGADLATLLGNWT